MPHDIHEPDLDRLYPSMRSAPPTGDSAPPRAPAGQVAAWEKQIAASPLAPTVKDSRAFVQAHGSPALDAVLNASGLGSHPELLKFVSTVAAKLNAIDPEALRERALRGLYPSLYRGR